MKLKMIYFLPSILFLVALAVATWYFFLARPGSLPRQEIEINGKTFSVEVANTVPARRQGLSGRASLGIDEGMLFTFPVSGKYGFWMKDMHFPLDFVWIYGGKVVGVTENVPPPSLEAGMLSLESYYPQEAVDMILEINAGQVAAYGIQAGQEVSLHIK